jgi:tetratricopeptide (TPR) repeat protein
MLFFVVNCWIRFAAWLCGIVALTIAASAASADPYIPADDNEVLESLPREFLSSRDELTTLRRQLANDPDNQQLAANVASRYLKLGKQESDPRFNGYAQAAIRPWWEDDNPPTEILRLRAKLKERDHRYDAALADLELLLQKQPHDVQAWIELANIYWVQGKYTEARQACDNLSKFADPIETLICSVPILAVTGKAEEAYASLAEILPTVRERWPAAVQWILTMQAEIAQALGRNAKAEEHYLGALVGGGRGPAARLAPLVERHHARPGRRPLRAGALDLAPGRRLLGRGRDGGPLARLLGLFLPLAAAADLLHAFDHSDVLSAGSWSGSFVALRVSATRRRMILR